MEFFKHLDSDLKTALKAQLRDLWTHTSTALEGNSLTLGETKFVIEEGLTVSGKPLADHQEVVGHARAIELIYVIDALIQYQLEAGLPAADKEFIKHGESLDHFKTLCFEHWRPSLNLVDRAHQRQAKRNKSAGKAQGADRDSDK